MAEKTDKLVRPKFEGSIMRACYRTSSRHRNFSKTYDSFEISSSSISNIVTKVKFLKIARALEDLAFSNANWLCEFDRAELINEARRMTKIAERIDLDS